MRSYSSAAYYELSRCETVTQSRGICHMNDAMVTHLMQMYPYHVIPNRAANVLEFLSGQNSGQLRALEILPMIIPTNR